MGGFLLVTVSGLAWEEWSDFEARARTRPGCQGKVLDFQAGVTQGLQDSQGELQAPQALGSGRGSDPNPTTELA